MSDLDWLMENESDYPTKPQLFRRGTSPEAKRIWAAVDKAAARCPPHVRKKAEEQAREHANEYLKKYKKDVEEYEKRFYTR